MIKVNESLDCPAPVTALNLSAGLARADGIERRIKKKKRRGSGKRNKKGRVKKISSDGIDIDSSDGRRWIYIVSPFGREFHFPRLSSGELESARADIDTSRRRGSRRLVFGT